MAAVFKSAGILVLGAGHAGSDSGASGASGESFEAGLASLLKLLADLPRNIRDHVVHKIGFCSAIDESGRFGHAEEDTKYCSHCCANVHGKGMKFCFGEAGFDEDHVSEDEAAGELVSGFPMQ